MTLTDEQRKENNKAAKARWRARNQDGITFYNKIHHIESKTVKTKKQIQNEMRIPVQHLQDFEKIYAVMARIKEPDELYWYLLNIIMKWGCDKTNEGDERDECR